MFLSLTDISQHTAGGLGDWQDVQQWSSPGYDIYHQAQQHPHAASPQNSGQLGSRESAEPQIRPYTVWPEAKTQVTHFPLDDLSESLFLSTS